MTHTHSYVINTASMLADGTWAKQEKSKYTPKTFLPKMISVNLRCSYVTSDCSCLRSFGCNYLMVWGWNILIDSWDWTDSGSGRREKGKMAAPVSGMCWFPSRTTGGNGNASLNSVTLRSFNSKNNSQQRLYGANQFTIVWLLSQESFRGTSTP